MKMRWSCARSCAALVGSTALLATAAQAATLSGSVSGPDGARLPRATVTIRNLDTDSITRFATGDHGRFRAAGLADGRYEVTARIDGFEPGVAEARIRDNEATSLDLRLNLSSLSESVSVIGEVPRDSLEATQIRESPARDVAEALAGTAGVFKLRKGGIANDVVIRGFQGHDMTVVIDGVRVHGACPNQMDPTTYHVDFSEVDRVEVGKGPFDIRNQGSLGGAVNIVTQDPSEGFGLAANVAAGSFGFINPSAALSYGNQSLAALAGYSFRASKAYSDGNGRQFTELANFKEDAGDRNAFEVGTAWGKALWRPATGHSLELSYSRQDSGIVYYPYLLMDAIYDDTNRFGLEYVAVDLSDTLTSLNVQAHASDVSHWMTNEYRTSAGSAPRGWSMGTLAETFSIGGRVDAQLRDVAVGVEVFERGWDAETELAMRQYAPQASIPDVRIGTVGVYAEYLNAIGDRLTLTAGARLDRIRTEADEAKANTDLYFAYFGSRTVERTDTLPSGKLSLGYEASSSVRLNIAVGHTVRVPHADERFFALQKMGSDRVGNPELEPARNTGIDAALSYERAGFSVQGHVFGNWIGDFITVRDRARINDVPGVMNSQARSFLNVDATMLGGEIDLAASLGSRLFLSGDVSYVRGRQTARPEDGIVSENLAEMPPLRLQARLRYDDGAFWGMVEGVFAADQDEVDADLNEERTPGYATANLSLGVRRGRLLVTAGVYNLFDRYYVEHLSYWRDPFRSGTRVPEPGRNIFANLAVRF